VIIIIFCVDLIVWATSDAVHEASSGPCVCLEILIHSSLLHYMMHLTVSFQCH